MLPLGEGFCLVRELHKIQLRSKSGMLNEQKTEWFECLKTFCHLNGREKQDLIVGDNSDARRTRFRFRSKVKHNWPSQWHTKYKGGYIEFENGKVFDLENQTVGGKPAFLFPVTPEINILWHRQTAENKIKRSMNEMAPEDRMAAAQLIQERADPKGDNKSFGRFPSLALLLLPALSVSELEAPAGLFDLPSNGPRAASAAPASCVEATPFVSARDPSPVPLRLVKTPERDSLSPRERAVFPT
jgi:hypothetical protein